MTSWNEDISAIPFERQSRENVGGTVACPQCGGRGFTQDGSKEVVCEYCGGIGFIPAGNTPDDVRDRSGDADVGREKAESEPEVRPVAAAQIDRLARQAERHREVVRVLERLANGVNPITGEVYEADSPYQNIQIVRALFYAVRVLEHTGLSDSEIDTANEGGQKDDPEDDNPFTDDPITEADLDVTGRAIISALREYRLPIAKQENIARFQIFPIRTMVEIAHYRPQTMRSLEAIHGMGKTRIEKYGADVLNIVALHIQSTEPKPDSEQEHTESGWLMPSPERQNLNEEQGLPKRAYAPWSTEEDEFLRSQYQQKLTARELGRLLQRQGGAIQSRLKKLGLV